MRRLFLTLVALMGATTLFAQTDMVATFTQAAANAKAGNFTEAIPQLDEVINAYYDLEEPDANQQKANPHHRVGILGGIDHADRADKAAGTHTRRNALAFELKDHRGDRAGNGSGKRRGDPDARVLANVAHLKHAGAQSL